MHGFHMPVYDATGREAGFWVYGLDGSEAGRSFCNELIWRGSVDGITVASNLDKMKRNVDKAINAMVKQADKLRSRAER